MSIASIPMHVERGCPPPKTIKTNAGGNQKADWKKVFSGAGLSKEKEFVKPWMARVLPYACSVEMKRILKPNYAMATPSDLRAVLSVGIYASPP